MTTDKPRQRVKRQNVTKAPSRTTETRFVSRLADRLHARAERREATSGAPPRITLWAAHHALAFPNALVIPRRLANEGSRSSDKSFTPRFLVGKPPRNDVVQRG
jgi:hypothetical protein